MMNSIEAMKEWLIFRNKDTFDEIDSQIKKMVLCNDRRIATHDLEINVDDLWFRVGLRYLEKLGFRVDTAIQSESGTKVKAKIKIWMY